MFGSIRFLKFKKKIALDAQSHRLVPYYSRLFPTYIKPPPMPFGLFNCFESLLDVVTYLYTMDVTALYTSFPINDEMMSFWLFFNQHNSNSSCTYSLVRLVELVFTIFRVSRKNSSSKSLVPAWAKTLESKNAKGHVQRHWTTHHLWTRIWIKRWLNVSFTAFKQFFIDLPFCSLFLSSPTELYFCRFLGCPFF